jgi:hypothetical protein
MYDLGAPHHQSFHTFPLMNTQRLIASSVFNLVGSELFLAKKTSPGSQDVQYLSKSSSMGFLNRAQALRYVVILGAFLPLGSFQAEILEVTLDLFFFIAHL